MDLQKLTEFLTLFNKMGNDTKEKELGLNSFVGKKVIVRTYSAGVHYGELVEKVKDEVILKNSRRLWRWKNKELQLSISEIAKYGLHSDSKICDSVDIWLQPIEIIPCSEEAIKSIEASDVFKA